MVADEYVTTSTYDSGDICIYEGVLYKALEDDITGDWDSTKWDAITISSELENSGTGNVADVYVNGVSVLDADTIAQIKSYKEVTQAEYDALPSSKLTDGVMYCIKDSEFGASDVPYDNTDSGLEADNVQDAIDEEVDALGDEVTLREELESATKVYGSVSGLPQPIATFTDGSSLPMPSLKTTIVPIQSGSGDPSPSNIRPISGWDEVNVSVCGKNLFCEDFTKYTKPVNYYILPIKMPIGTSFIFNATKTGNAVSGIVVGYVRDGDRYSNFVGQSYVIDSSGNVYTRTFTADDTYKNPKLIFYGNATNFAEVLANYEIQLELGSTATTYEPYNGHTYTIPFTDSQGNPIEVFGGECDIVNGGENPSTLKKVVFDGSNDEGWTEYEYNTIKSFRINISDIKALSTSEDLCMCNRYKYQSFAWASNEYARYGCSGNTVYFRPPNDTITSLSDFKTWLSSNNIEFIYPLSTPSTFTSQPTSIKSLEGSNNVWGDTGKIKDLKYVRNLNITINDLISRVEALEG